ncbi:hypothetical protein SAMN05216201_11394 [Pseudomonas linyingensis]|uniref:Uncharacterized protein n=1 Tax=Pseudomonas linyingensis TaxID=915471 RepID=A0A1H7ALF3_9PSED|nr:hypothetical protein [Pseudomonas linyingensis]SEJ66198.1 hypothetical protein SAMN05216201_11394 [Pseudomonas linyingensis]
MRKRAEGLSWIDKGNSEQIQWAADYLRQRGSLSKEAATLGVRDYEALLKEGLYLEKSAEGVRTLQRMQAAWRQRIYRQPHHGRKPYTFTLPTQTKQHLSRQAEKCGHTETEHLIQLIDQGYEEAIRSSRRMKEVRAKERKDLPRLKAEVVFLQLREKELTKHLRESLLARFAAESVPAEELEQKVDREMSRVAREVRVLMDEQVKSNPRLKHMGI